MIRQGESQVDARLDTEGVQPYHPHFIIPYLNISINSNINTNNNITKAGTPILWERRRRLLNSNIYSTNNHAGTPESWERRPAPHQQRRQQLPHTH